MDDREFDSFSEGLPSPEELFHGNEWENSKRVGEQDGEKAEAPFPEGLQEREECKRPGIFSAGPIIVLLMICALVFMNLRFFHIHLFCMSSEGMGDVIPKGSIIISREVPAEKLETGDVITYRNGDGCLVTHQIVGMAENYEESGCNAFLTKGAADTSEDGDTVTYSMIKGKALIYIPYLGLPFVKQ